MAKKNLQTLAMRNALSVRVTGMECNGSKQADGELQAHVPSLLWHPGFFPHAPMFPRSRWVWAA